MMTYMTPRATSPVRASSAIPRLFEARLLVYLAPRTRRLVIPGTMVHLLGRPRSARRLVGQTRLDATRPQGRSRALFFFSYTEISLIQELSAIIADSLPGSRKPGRAGGSAPLPISQARAAPAMVKYL